jgi:D-glycero-alpha-D-manno-heptose-7-phosphate kinase
MDEPLQISTSADLPANSGLGSSSSFAVALLNGLHAIRGKEVSLMQIAEEACQAEIGILKSPIGKQDQYAAAFGGMNYFEFRENGSVEVEPMYLSSTDAGRFLDKSLLIWTGQTRKADVILEDQSLRAESNFDQLLQITELAKSFRELLLASNLDWTKLGSLISQGWKLKQSFSDKISTDEVRAITAQLDDLNCYGYKLLGAGGGGFIFAIFDEINEKKFESLNKWRTLRPSLDHAGARIVSVN